MRRKRLMSIAILALCLVTVAPVLAEVPTEGIVQEGVSVPGIELGFSRAQVESAYGEPYYCQTYSVPGDAAFCTFRAGGGGLVSVRYRGADGGFADNSSDDTVIEIRWGETLSGWTTTAGVNAALAKADPDAVVAAYPDAKVVYRDSGLIESVTDWLQGVEVRWSYDPYTGATHVTMSIFDPLASLPDAQATHVETIEVRAYKERGRRYINAWAEILDGYQQAATYATVDAIWVLPDGSTQPAYEDLVGLDGTASFQLIGKLRRGTYELRIIDVQLADHEFDRSASVLRASVYFK